jgi:hypothetical protein
MYQHALAVDIPHLKMHPFLDAQTAGINGVQAGLIALIANTSENRTPSSIENTVGSFFSLAPRARSRMTHF